MKTLRKDLVGKRVGIVTILEYAGVKPVQGRKYIRDQHHWLVKCECGSVLEMSYARLSSTGGPSGCADSCQSRIRQRSERCKPTLVSTSDCTDSYLQRRSRKAAQRIYATYKRSARLRNLEWNLTKEDFYRLIISPCHYTGLPPNKALATESGIFYWNGIDRKDNQRGYTIDNCVPCCSFANFAKRDKSYEDFILWLDQLAKFRTEQKALENIFEE